MFRKEDLIFRQYIVQPVHAVAGQMLPREKAGAGRRAYRVIDVATLEQRALRSKPVQIGCVRGVEPVAAQ